MKTNPFVMLKEEFDGNGVLFNPDNNKLLTLNPAGVTLWKAFRSGATAEEGAKALTEQFEVSLELAQQDTDKFIQDLLRLDLISLD